jgi:glycosyltransferase involved in cell wall biosynthesis
VITALVVLAFVFAAIPCALYFRNSKVFFRLGSATVAERRAISVLIPARNEERGIEACIRALIASEQVELEVIVLDDHSTDDTATIVNRLATEDTRVKLATAPELPIGWSGKQHACYTLSRLAKHDLFVFLDADVRLQPNALASLAQFQTDAKTELVSGFPRQETVVFTEHLIIPLINWLLLSYLPLDRMRADKSPSLGAGCGQWFLTTRQAYETTGGHSHLIVKNSFHDGIKLPRSYRQHGLRTDVADGTDVATCRMYRSAGQVWNGFAKNAREGIGSPKGIWLWTFLLWAGHILPFTLLGASAVLNLFQVIVVALACAMSLAPRVHAVGRFRTAWITVVLHPLAILGLLAIQWYATVRAWIGKPVGWKGRTLQTPESKS